MNVFFNVGGNEVSPPGKQVITEDINLAIERFRTLNPVLSKDEGVYYLNKLIYESLFVLDENLAAVPLLAESWAYSEDGKVLSIQLKTGIVWQDGSPFDGNDVVFSIDSFKANPNEHIYGENIRNIERAVVDRKDSSLITIYFRSVYNAGTELLTFPILPKQLYKNVSTLRRSRDQFIPIGTGPYMVTGFDIYSHIILTGNPLYHGSIPTNRLIFQIMSNIEDALQMLASNQISFAISKSGNRDIIYRNPMINAISFLSNEAVWLGYNFDNIFLSAKDVRHAIAYAIDCREILETCYFNNGILSDSIYPPGFLGVGHDENPFEVDLEKARTLFDKAGFKDVDQDGLLDCYYTDGVDGYWTPFSLKMLVNESDSLRVEAARLIQSGFQKIGLDCELDFKQEEEYMAALNAGEFDLYLGSGQFNEAYDLRPLLHSEYNNLIGYENTDLDYLLDRFTCANSTEQRIELFKGIYNLLNDELPYYCLLYKSYGAVGSPALEGDMEPLFNNIYKGCETWKCITVITAD